MHRLSGSRSISLLVLVAALWLGNAYGQDFLGDVLSTSNTQLWKSFQEEMKTLEQAAHRVNTLLVNAHQPKAEADQEAKPAEQPEVTVLASRDVLRDGLHTKLESPKTKENRQEEKAEPELAGGIDESFNPHHLNLGSFINSFGLFKSLPEPWWKGKNVCVEKSEMVEDKQQGEKEVNKHLIIMGTGTFEHCKQTSGKYICKTVTSTPQSTKTVSVTYQCCEGSRRQGNECVQGEKPFPSSTSLYEPAFIPDKDAVPQANYNSANFGESSEEKSFSSQSEEKNGHPRWLHNYLSNPWMKK
uniref:Uncharacterized protein n=1 Tax=Homalodisca liturata TaxID=320908 RepID=A0A1B6HSG4_9HEMI